MREERLTRLPAGTDLVCEVTQCGCLLQSIAVILVVVRRFLVVPPGAE